ncbi:acetoacetate decarboxylase family protein [Paraburkholderia sp. J63]|uniref:acetoacetate decarboxylase family protein n=1 Tax=Paraburkholderia sp. J63 TaxID=2805434 RepID=UPI002ABE5003|nr:acetoacetate decarboxylase family protein [Paraburkholderia sp. J63]
MSLTPNSPRHRMPFVFGPSAGPRQGPAGERYDMSHARRTVASVSFLTEARLLETLLPPACELDGEPVVTIEHAVLHALEWLAGRDYAMLSVKFPVRYRGRRETVRGPFLSVVWENRVEPILTGREELGFAKLYCELPRARELRDARHYCAQWDGHTFMKMTLDKLVAAAPPQGTTYDGLLHHRYQPSLRSVGAAAIDEMVISPAGGVDLRYESFEFATGSVEFIESTWEQIPTMFHIVNSLAALPLVEVRRSSLARTLGATDLANQRALE